MSWPETYVPGFHDEAAIRKMQYNNFGRTGLRVSKLSLGTSGFSLLYGDFTLEQCKQTVLQALKAGINYIDTAPWYGQGVSESTLGQCLDGIPRESYYIATKVGRYEKDPERMFDFSAAKTRTSIEESLKKLKLKYVDVLQIHDVEFAPSIDYVIRETLPVLIEAKRQGTVKFIGVTGYPVRVLAEFAEKSSDIDMILSYSRLTLIDQELLNYTKKLQHVAVINAAVLGMGILTKKGPPIWHPASRVIKDACKAAANYCQTMGVNLSKLALAFAFNSFGDSVLNGMNNPQLLESALQVLHDGLTEHEEDVLLYVQEKFFKQLSVNHWEGIELAGLKERSDKMIRMAEK